MRWFYDKVFHLGVGALVVLVLWFLAVIFVGATGCSTLYRGRTDPDRRPGGFEITNPKPGQERKAMVNDR
jgi:hypothetical protein